MKKDKCNTEMLLLRIETIMSTFPLQRESLNSDSVSDEDSD